MEKITHTSPRTGLTYEAVLKTEPYTRYEITLDGRWVQFALTADGIAGSVAHAEGVADGWTSSARD